MKSEAGEGFQVRHNQVIARPRLSRLLDDATAQIILLVAPAGYGKTTLARAWLSKRPHNWYRGTPATADVAALALGLAKAASRVVPSAGERLKTRLRRSQAPADEVDDLAELLAEDLSDWPDNHWLAFDDYQFACDSEPAERFVELLAEKSHVRLLIASRTRPRWATARRALYGEIFEIGRTLLAMNEDEAKCVFNNSSTVRTSALLALADGWPALIGLATFSLEPDVPTEAVPAELYSFFAEELYRVAEADLQQALRRLSLAPYVTSDIAEIVIGDDPELFIDKGIELGFFVSSRERPELHPLLRTFLLSKFRKHHDDPTGYYVAKLARVLISLSEWDDAFELASRFADDEVLIELFEASLPQMLDHARVPTLWRWIAAAKSRRIDSPIVDLAEAELSFRRDELSRAEALACRAASRFRDDDSFASRSYWIAGTSAHLSVDDETAAEYFGAAERTARCDTDTRAAMWGRFLAAEALERSDEAEALLTDFATRCGDTVDELLRIASGRLLMTSLTGGIHQTLSDQRKIAQIVDRSRDPLIASGYLNAYATLLVVAGQYEEALAAAEAQSALAITHSLGFVEPFACLHAASAHWGLRNLRTCRMNLRQCERSSSNNRLLTFVSQFLCRIHLASRKPEEALRVLERTEETASVSQSLHAEHLAWWSLAHAMSGNESEATELAEAADSMSCRLEVSGLVPWVNAVLAVDTSAAMRSAIGAFDAAIDCECIDPFVTTYRACPRLLELIAADNSRRKSLRSILERARDHTLAEQAGIRLPAPRDKDGLGSLTKREHEVIELVAQGLTNKEIGRTLFITEATAKKHVQNACAKLGVRRRTEAAMRVSELIG